MENEKTVKKFDEPRLEIVRFTERDIITASEGGLNEDNPIEGEFIPLLSCEQGGAAQ